MEQGAKGKKSGAAILLVVLGCGGVTVIAILGILAAIAVPAFLRSIKKAKSSEAELMVMSISTELSLKYSGECKFPEPLPASAPLPVGGEKVLPASPEIARQWIEFGVPIDKPHYFTYSMEREDANTYIVRARADFTAGGPVHMLERRVVGDPDACMAETGPATTMNEFD